MIPCCCVFTDMAKVCNNFVTFIKNLIVCFYVLIDFIYIDRRLFFLMMFICDIILIFEPINMLSVMENRILVVDDEEALCEILKFNLEAESYVVDVAYSAESALSLDLSIYSLIILDVMMGQMSGIDFLRYLKGHPHYSSIPVILCSALDQENDKVLGLETGADDYVAKPFSVREMVARVRSLLRRVTSQQKQPSNILTLETLVVNISEKHCAIDGEEVLLTKKEFDILVLLLQNRGVILSREQILQSVWEDDVVVLGRTVDVNITRLRKKLGVYGNRIVTKLGYGYSFK